MQISKRAEYGKEDYFRYLDLITVLNRFLVMQFSDNLVILRNESKDQY